MDGTQEQVVTAVQLPDGTRMLFQGIQVGPAPQAIAPEEDIEDEVGLITHRLDGVTASLSAFAGSVSQALKSACPDRMTVEFGCQVGVETGALVALITKGSMDANLKVTLEWNGRGSNSADTDQP